MGAVEQPKVPLSGPVLPPDQASAAQGVPQAPLHEVGRVVGGRLAAWVRARGMTAFSLSSCRWLSILWLLQGLARPPGVVSAGWPEEPVAEAVRRRIPDAGTVRKARNDRHNSRGRHNNGDRRASNGRLCRGLCRVPSLQHWRES